MSLFDDQRAMLRQVAEALGAELRNQVAFVGGCTTGLLLTKKRDKPRYFRPRKDSAGAAGALYYWI